MKPSAVTTAEFDLDPVFDPPEAMIDRILHDIAGPEGSLRDLALAFSTTAPALAAWLARPDIAARLEALHTAAAMRVRLVAATALPRVVSVALAIINQFHADESHVITHTSSIREAEYHRRGAETARRAVS